MSTAPLTQRDARRLIRMADQDMLRVAAQAINLIDPSDSVTARLVESGWAINMRTRILDCCRTFRHRPLSDSEFTYLVMHEAGHLLWSESCNVPNVAHRDRYMEIWNACEDMRSERMSAGVYPGFKSLRESVGMAFLYQSYSDQRDSIIRTGDACRASWLDAMHRDFSGRGYGLDWSYVPELEQACADTLPLYRKAARCRTMAAMMPHVDAIYRLLFPDTDSGKGGDESSQGDDASSDASQDDASSESEGATSDEATSDDDASESDASSEDGATSDDASEDDASSSDSEGDASDASEDDASSGSETDDASDDGSPGDSSAEDGGEDASDASSDDASDSEGGDPSDDGTTSEDGAESDDASSEGEASSEGGDSDSDSGEPSDSGDPSDSSAEGIGDDTTSGSAETSDDTTREGDASETPPDETSEVDPSNVWEGTDESFNPSDPETHKPLTYDKFGGWANAVDKAISGGMSSIMRMMMRQNEMADKRRGLQSGRIDRKRFHKTKVGDYKVFYRNREPGAPRYMLIISVDCSGSMGSIMQDGTMTRADAALRAAATLAESWRATRQPFTVFGWGGTIQYVVTDRDKRSALDVAHLRRQADSNTVEAVAAEYAWQIVTRAAADGYIPLWLHITDGGTRTVRQDIIDKFVSTYGKGHLYWIGIDRGHTVASWPNVVTIRQPSELLDYMRNVVRRQVSRERIRIY